MTEIVSHYEDDSVVDLEGYLSNPNNVAMFAYQSTLEEDWLKNRPIQYKDWTKATWYIMPKDLTPAEQKYPQVEKGSNICSLSIPFQGRAFDTGYVNPFDLSNSFIGIKDSAIMCNAPL